MEVLSYLFSPIPGSSFNYATHLYIYAGILVAVAIIFKVLIIVKKENKALKKTYRSTPGEFLWIAGILIILTASRTNGIAYLSMRFLLFIVLALSVYYIVRNIHRFFKKYPEMKKVTQPKVEKKDKPVYTTKKKRR